MITEEKCSEIIRLYDQLKNLRKTAIQASVSKHTIIRVLKNRNQKTGKEIGCPEALSALDKKRIKRMTCQSIRQDELVTSCIIKNRTGVTTSH